MTGFTMNNNTMDFLKAYTNDFVSSIEKEEAEGFAKLNAALNANEKRKENKSKSENGFTMNKKNTMNELNAFANDFFGSSFNDFVKSVF